MAGWESHEEEKKKGQVAGKETLRESARRSEKHESRISLSITYALNPGIYASGINARALGNEISGLGRARGVRSRARIRARRSTRAQWRRSVAAVMARERYPVVVFEPRAVYSFDNRE